MRLAVNSISRRFGKLSALADISLQLAAEERCAIIGPNGSGKSTLFAVIGGQLAPSAGRIFLNERDVTVYPAHRRARLGIARTFQRNSLFGGLTVSENIRLAVQAHGVSRFDMFWPTTTHPNVVRKTEQVLTDLQLDPLSHRRVEELSYGDQRRLEIALSLAANPAVLLIDEPTQGMSSSETSAMVRVLNALPKSTTLLIIEHDMDVVAEITDRVVVLQSGRMLAKGSWAEVRNDDRVREAYLGRKRHGTRRA